MLPCVIYLHGNAGCRLAAHEVLRCLLTSSVTVVGFDFAGSGQSEGEYVSLGHYERHDVAAVVAHLRASGLVSTVGLWGHSMGAVTALLYADLDPSVAGIVLDSPFADLMELSDDLLARAKEAGVKFPGMKLAAKMASVLVRRTVRSKAKFDPKEVSPIAVCPRAFAPALFAHGQDDDFMRALATRPPDRGPGAHARRPQPAQAQPSAARRVRGGQEPNHL